MHNLFTEKLHTQRTTKEAQPMERPYYKRPRQYTAQPRKDNRKEQAVTYIIEAFSMLACIAVFMLIAFN